LIGTLVLLVGAILRLFRSRRSLLLENLALRQQLEALKRRRSRPKQRLYIRCLLNLNPRRAALLSRVAYTLAVTACLWCGRFWAKFVTTALGLDDPRVHCEQFNDGPEQA
jgi:hypothetical protein